MTDCVGPGFEPLKFFSFEKLMHQSKYEFNGYNPHMAEEELLKSSLNFDLFEELDNSS